VMAPQPLAARFPALARLGMGGRRSIPFVQQLDATECGAACLAMVLGFLGKDVSLEAVRDRCGGGRDGVSARTIIDVAPHFGLRGRGVKLELDQLGLLRPGTTILHWEFQHFVVLAGIGADAVEIVDPALGRRSIPMEEFQRAFTGVALLFEPGELFRRGKRPGVLLPAIGHIIRESGLLGRIVVTSLALQGCGLTLPLLTGQVVDRVLPRGDRGLLVVLLAGLAVLLVFRTLAQLVRGHLLLHLKTLLDARMSLGFLDHLVRLPLAFFQRRGAGDLMMRLNSNSIVREHLTHTVVSGLIDGALVLVSLVILLLGSRALAAVALLAAGLEAGIYLAFRRRQRELAVRELDVEARAHSHEVELLTAIETLKSSGCEDRAVGRWSNLLVDRLNVRLRRDGLSLATGAAADAVRAAAPLALLAVGALQVLQGHLTLGSMLALAAIAANFFEPLAGLIQTAGGLELVRAYLARVNDVLETTPEQSPGATLPAHRLEGAIRLEDVTFRYHPQAAPAVVEVSAEIRPGQFVAVVGPSGSGKTTLAHLLTGLYRPQAGRVLFDGRDAATLDLGELRRQLGVVNQSFALFGTTIRENIALADPALPLAEVERAARLACLHEEIAALPLGYNTPLLDRGTALSGGQRQRVALARALVRQPRILLLDEATSALDAATERQVQGALQTLDCTRVVIAHRLSTVRAADLILVMEEGALVEAGDHQTLLDQGGAYARLVAAQLETSEERPGEMVRPGPQRENERRAR
jgi:ATP-binding cassette, subfamily B, bacterial